MNIAFSMPITNLDPYQEYFGAQVAVFPLIYSFLVVPREDGTFAPDLAMRWWSDDNQKTWHFVLQPEARFHSGRPVLASDVAYSIERMRQNNAIFNQAIERIECPSDRRLTIILKQNVPYFLYQLAIESIVPRPEPGDPSQDENPIGSGPFMVYFRDTDQQLMLVAFKDYFKGRPYLDAINVVYEPDKEKIWMDYMFKNLDTCWSASPENVWFMRIAPDQYHLEGNYDQQVTTLLFNLQDPLFSDVRVRKTLAKMLDLEQHINEDLKGLAESSPGPLGLFSPFKPAEVTQMGLDSEGARQGLDELGWHDTDMDMYPDRGGRKFDFQLLVPLTFQMERETAVYLQRAFNQFGIRAHIVDKRFDKMYYEDLKPGTFQACLTKQNVNPRRLDLLAKYWSSADRGVYNYSSYRNTSVDDEIEKIMTGEKLDDPAIQLEKIHNHLVADIPALWLYHSYQIHGFSPMIQGLSRPNPGFYPTFDLRQAWLLPKAKK